MRNLRILTPSLVDVVPGSNRLSVVPVEDSSGQSTITAKNIYRSLSIVF